MMKISKDSWHYKINIFSFKSSSLCGYFWQVVLSAIVLLACFCVAFYLGACAAAPIVWLVMGVPQLDGSDINSTLVFSGIAIWLLILLGVLDAAFKYVKRRLKRRTKPIKNEADEIKEAEPNIALEYIKAKKQKVCPILEFDDE